MSIIIINEWLSAFERFHVPCLVELSLGFICGKRNGVRWVTLHDATLTVSNDESPYFHSSPLPHPVAVAGKNTKLPAHLRQVKQLSLTRLFSAESLGFPRSREGERALCLPKEQGRVCTLPCLREGSFTLQDGAHFWSLHPLPALYISSPTPGMFAISQNSFMPDFYLFKEPFTLDFGK
ncbi:hypothetical protein T06_2722 [Trichinella sp. T6]|nr:hypothetical protein T06_2722 [Trichinella sp. T6]